MTNNEKMINLKNVFGRDVGVLNAKTYHETVKNVRAVVSAIVSTYAYEIAYREGKINAVDSCRISARFGNLDENTTSKGTTGARRVHAIAFGLIELASVGTFTGSFGFDDFKREIDMMITPIIKADLGI